MRKPVLVAGLLILAASGSLQAQTLFTYGGKPVQKADFLRIYQKNSLAKKPDFSEKVLQEYLDLYSLFRMKVTEAEAQQLDTTAAIQRELENYRRQLAKGYLVDATANERLVQEAYNRMKEEVRVAHILIPVPQNGDTTAAYRTADSVYKAAIKKGADFGALAKAVSEDRGSKANGGDIGYITGLQTIYPFENAAYNTPVGSISKPFRTQFGYHVVKVISRRPARGEVQVSQIMALAPKSRGPEGVGAAQKTIDSARASLKAGMSWDEAVKKYSQDKFTRDQGGKLEPFGVGRTTPVFEDAAFGLKKPGDISEPVVTDFGVHLLRLESKTPLKPFDSVKTDLRRRVESDGRSQIAKEQYIAGVKVRNGWKEYPEAYNAVLAQFQAIPDTGKEGNAFTAREFSNQSRPIFTLGGNNYTGADFMRYAESVTRGRIMGNRPVVLRDLYNMYATQVLNDFQLQNLSKENVEFRALMDEYRDGILLFDLMDRNVWSRAGKDSVGLQAFYETNKTHYVWEPGFSGVVYRFKDKTTADQAAKLIAKGSKDEELQKALNTDQIPDAIVIDRGRKEWSSFKSVPRSEIVAGKASPVTAVSMDGRTSYVIIKADKIYDVPSQKTLDEARGYAVAEYQDYLEKTWNTRLRASYPVEVNAQVFRSMVR